MPEVGDWVIMKELPPWVDQFDEETQEIFRFCVGRPYRVDEIDQWGQLVLDVSADIDERFGGFMNDIRVEEEYVTLVERD